MMIVRLGYSRSPWRLVDSSGREVYIDTPFRHPDLGHMTVAGPVCGDTKAECLRVALGLLQALVDSKICPAGLRVRPGAAEST